MAISITGTVAHTKTVVGSDDPTKEVNKAEWNGTSAHTVSISFAGLTANALLLSDGTDLTQDGTNLLYTTTSGPRLQIGSSGTSTGLILGYSSASGFAAIWNSRDSASLTLNNAWIYGDNSSQIIFRIGSIASYWRDTAGNDKFTLSATAGQGPQILAGTATTDVNALSATQTWNAAGVAFTGIKFTITDTASAAGSLAMQILGGAAGTTNLFSVSKAGAQLNPSGSATVPTYTFAAAPTYGMYFNSASGVAFTHNGSDTFGTKTGQLAAVSSVVIGWSVGALSQGLDTAFSRISAGLIGVGTGAAGSFAGSLKLTNTQNVGYHELDEMTAPAGAANSARLFTQDNGAGKTQLMVIFGSGAAQQLAIEA